MSTDNRSKVSRRLTEGVAPEVIELIYKPRLDTDFAEFWKYLNEINQAHLLMLEKRRLLKPDIARALAAALCQVEAEGSQAVPLDPQREDAYFNYEARLTSIAGRDAGGRIHIGRSRNDILATMDRLRARDLVLELIQVLVSVRSAALRGARSYVKVVMPGYTHLQPAQPITFGFYLCAVAQALARDSERLQETFGRINQSPLGACALAGTAFPIDREETATLLGFSGLVENTLDAVASRDFAFELLSDIATLAVTWSRIAQDFYVWSTHEFQMVDFPDSVASTSSIMPQKKNHVVIEHLKGRAGFIIGLMTAAISTARATNFTHAGDSNRETVRSLWLVGKECLSCLQLFELLLRTAKPNPELMLKRVTEDFASATDLADALVLHADIPFREAHYVVGAVVRKALDCGLRANEITCDMVRAAAAEQLGREIHISPEMVHECLDPMRSVSNRALPGGPAPDATIKTIEVLEAELARIAATNASRQSAIAEKRAALKLAVTGLACTHSKV